MCFLDQGACCSSHTAQGSCNTSTFEEAPRGQVLAFGLVRRPLTEDPGTYPETERGTGRPPSGYSASGKTGV